MKGVLFVRVERRVEPKPPLCHEPMEYLKKLEEEEKEHKDMKLKKHSASRKAFSRRDCMTRIAANSFKMWRSLPSAVESSSHSIILKRLDLRGAL